MANNKRDHREFAKRVLIAAFVVIAVVAGLSLLWSTAHVFLLLFAAILVAVLLRALADALARRTPLSPGWSLTIVVITLFAMTVGIVWLYGADIMDGTIELIRSLPQAFESVRANMAKYPWGKRVLEILSQIEWSAYTPDLVKQLLGVFSTAVPAIAGLLIVVVLGLYLSAEPRRYVGGLIRLTPVHRRDRAKQVLDRVACVLKWFLIARGISMLMLFAFTWLGLWWLDIPFAFPLALLAGLLEFIPNIGPILSAVPAILVAFSQSPLQALWVLLLYVVLQQMESYLLTPLLQRQMIHLAPALLFVTQLVMGVLFGILGLLLAAPLAAVLMVLVHMLYVEDVLGDKSSTDGAGGAS